MTAESSAPARGLDAPIRAPATSPEAARAPSVAALGICFAAGAAIAGASLIGLAGQTRSLQFVAYIVGFGAVLPAAAWLAWRHAGGDATTARLRSAAVACGVAAAILICALRALTATALSPDAIAILGVTGGLGLAGLAVRAAALGPRMPAPRLPALAAGALAAVALCFAPAQLSPAAAVVALAIGAVLFAGRFGLELPSVSRRVGIALDVALALAAAALVFDVSGYWSTDFAVNAAPTILPEQLGPTAQIHQHFYLGAVNDILHGRTLLVDANSVYGIGNAYVIAGWFELFPFGYGPFGLLGSLFSTAMVLAGWAIARVAGVGRAIAAITVAIAILLTVLAPITSPSLFLNVGGLRFAPPFLLLAVALLAARPEGRSTAASPPVLAVFALFSLWSVEAVTYCACALAGVVAVEALAASRLRAGLMTVARSAGLLLGAAVAAHVVFALATRAAGGQWPAWGEYLSLFQAWADVLATAFGGEAEPWSRAWLMGGLYVASAIGVIFLARGAPPGDRRALMALAGITTTGIGFLSYFVAHSFDLFLPFVALPALLVVAAWTSLALRALPGGAPAGGWGRAALALGAFAAVCVTAASWSAGSERLPRTVAAHLVPGGPSLAEDVELMWSSPPVDERAPAAEQLIESHFPEDFALVLTEPDLGQEALQRSGRANLLPISYPWQDEVDLEHALPPVEDAVEELRAGTMVLFQTPPPPGAEPSVSLLFEQVGGNVPEGSRLGPLAQAAFDGIEERFRLVPVARGPDGLVAARLEPRSGAG